MKGRGSQIDPPPTKTTLKKPSLIRINEFRIAFSKWLLFYSHPQDHKNFYCMFLFPIGLVDDIMLREVDAVLKQTSILGKIAAKFDNSFQECKSLVKCQGRMLIIAA